MTRPPLPIGDPRHGTTNGYRNRGCRCDACREAANATRTLDRQKAKAAPKDPTDRRHGTVSFYAHHGCRCGRCTAANTEKGRRRTARLTEHDLGPVQYHPDRLSWTLGCDCGAWWFSLSSAQDVEANGRQHLAVVERLQ